MAESPIRHRHQIEQKNAELMRWERLERARYWGRVKVYGQALLATLVANAKGVVKLLRAGASQCSWPRGQDKREQRRGGRSFKTESGNRERPPKPWCLREPGPSPRPFSAIPMGALSRSAEGG